MKHMMLLTLLIALMLICNCAYKTRIYKGMVTGGCQGATNMVGAAYGADCWCADTTEDWYEVKCK